MAQTRAAAKVGAVVLVATALFAGMAWFFLGRGIGGYPVDVSFKDAQGTKEGADVRLAGVKIGLVRSIDVDPSGRRALLHLNVFKDRRIPERAVFTLTSGGLLGEMFVQVMPNPKGETGKSLPDKGKPIPSITGTDLPTFDDLRLKAADLGNGAGDIVDDMHRISTRLAALAADPYFEEKAKNTAGNVASASRDAALAAARVNAMLAQEIPLLRQMVAEVEAGTRTLGPMGRNANQIITNAAQTTANVNRVVKNLNESITFLQGALKDTLAEAEIGPNAKATMANIREASRNFAAVSADAEKISNDLATKGEANSKVGETVNALMKVSDKASAFLDKLTGVANKAGKVRAPRLRMTHQFEAYQAFGTGNRFSADVNMFFPSGGSSALLLGLGDVGEGNRLNLQNVATVTKRFQVRYGIHASRLGVGAEFSQNGVLSAPGLPLTRGTKSLSVDLYSPNEPQLNIYERRQINENLGLSLGFRDVLHTAHPSVALTYRQ